MVPTGRSALGAAATSTRLHHDTYRIFCFLAGALSPAFGLIYHFTDPTATDPLWARFALALPMLLLLSLSYMSAWVEAHFVRLVHGLFYLLTAYFVGVTTLNAYSPNYALGCLFAITGIGVAFSLGLRDLRPLAIYLSSAALMCILAVWLSARPEVSPAIMSISALSTALVIYVAAYSRVRAERTKAATEQRYYTLVDSANDAIFIIDPQADLLLEANRKAQELTGRSLDVLRRMRLRDLFAAEKQDHYAALFHEHVYEGAPLTEEIGLQSSSGELVPVDISASLTEVDGKQLIQGIFRDATQRQRYQKQLIEAKEQAEEMLRLKSSFLNNMSHELRTPLTSILGYAEILLEETSSEQQEFARHITESAKRLQDTVNSVLDLAQLESEKARLQLEPTDVAEEVRQSVALLQSLADQKGLSLKCVTSSPHTQIAGNASCIHRIVNNLVGNAIKFTAHGGVTVEVGARPGEVFLRVTDTGIGIAPEFQEHLFDEFRQESTGLRRSHEGSGLGLAITRRLTGLLGGSIEVESQKGLGSTFTVSFPRQAEGLGGTDSSGRSSSNGSSPSNGHLGSNGSAGTPAHRAAKRVLVVEDHPSTRALITHHLRALCNVATASSPEEALRLAQSTTFDAFLLDIHLSAELNGVDVLQALRAMPAYREAPAVALTAYALPADRARFLEAGFNVHLPKPFTAQQLSEALDVVLPRQHAARTAH